MEDWTDEQWQQYYDAINTGKQGAKHDTPLSDSEKQDLKNYARDPRGWTERARNKIKNQHWKQVYDNNSSSSGSSNSSSVDDAINNTDWS